ncbi:MAG: thioredoxin domain-containing protein [Hyphomicrobiaceae bacterium]
MPIQSLQRSIFAATLCALMAGLSGCAGDTDLIANTPGNTNQSEDFAGSTLSGAPGYKPAAGPRQIIKKPTLAQVLQVQSLPDRAFGNPNAPIKVVKYASLTCPICRKFQRVVFPEFKKTYIDTGKVYFILRMFPIGRSAGNAAIALRCAPKNKHLALYNKFLDQQHKWVSQEVRLDAIYSVAKQVGMTRPQFESCLKNQSMIQGLQWAKERGRTLGIIGTPNFFIQNKLIKKALDMDGMRAEIDPLLAQNQAASVAQPANRQ